MTTTGINMRPGYAGIAAGMASWLTHAARAFTPEQVLKTIREPSKVLRMAMGYVRRFPADQSLLTEAQNRLTAFRCFALGAVAAKPRDVESAVANLAGVNDYESLWTTEGVGYFAAAHHLRYAVEPTGLLTRLQLPSRSLIPLHTGMGLAFAVNVLVNARTSSSAVTCGIALDRFDWLCRQNSVGGYYGAAYEAIGIASGLLCPNKVSMIAARLKRCSADSYQRFWHGFGRGLYFGPQSFIPCVGIIETALETAQRQPDDIEGRRNAVAGLAWAVTLLNIRHPQVVESFLKRNFHGNYGDAFANGVDSALTLWHDWAPESDYVRRFCRCGSRTAGTCTTDHHCGYFERSFNVGRGQSRLEDLFRYQPVSISQHPGKCSRLQNGD